MGNIDAHTHKPWVVLPVKAVEQSNSRLKPLLSPTEREQLTLTMLEDVVDTLGCVSDLGGLLVVTGCPIVKEYLSKLDVIYLEEGGRPELNSAINKGVQFLEKMGTRKFFTIPGDVPLLAVAEINQLTACLRSTEGIILVPAHDGAGTNSIASSIPIQITTQFGMNSLAAHRRIARDQGLSVDVLPLSGLGFDIDWPDDLIQLASMGGDSNTHRFLNNIDLVQRRNRSKSLDHSSAAQAERMI
tara:strand:- start:563 stop:1291 length:729 start_codon:yes stop_codon:yes gene_type:complete